MYISQNLSINLAYRDEDAEAAKAEEEEALAIQRSVYHNIKTDNLGAHLFVSLQMYLITCDSRLFCRLLNITLFNSFYKKHFYLSVVFGNGCELNTFYYFESQYE